MSYIGIGVDNPNHNLEVSGQAHVEAVEGGKRSQRVPFEILSDYTGKRTLTDSRQLRLRVTPSENDTSTSHIDMGMDNQYGNVFFISQPVFDSTVSGDRVFTIDNDQTVGIYDYDNPLSNISTTNLIIDNILSSYSNINSEYSTISINVGNNVPTINSGVNNTTKDGDSIALKIQNISGAYTSTLKFASYDKKNIEISTITNKLTDGDTVQINGIYINSSGGIIAEGGYRNFTGSHECIVNDIIENGFIVSVNPNKKMEKITINSAIPFVHESNVSMDPNVFGVMSNKYVNALGEGAIWVSDANGTFTAGDYITSSILAGYGQKQSSNYMKNYTVGKILEKCDFSRDPRYLSMTDDGALTIISNDEYKTSTSNVYKAQLVGCTYHCG
jgi:hypothetical protein